MESKAMNIFDSLIPATNGTASMKGASLSIEPETELISIGIVRIENES